jgi:hypothetical protein
MVKRNLDTLLERHDAPTIIKRLERELGDAKTKIGMQAAVREVLGLHDLAGRSAAPAWTYEEDPPKESPGCPVLFLSDLHWGELVDSEQLNGVNSFDLATARKRLRYTVETAVKLCGILDPKMRYPGIVVPLGGDMVSGDIHEELTATNELPTIPTVLDLATHLEGAIGLLADKFGRVFLPCVSGNHGRNTRKPWAKNRNATSFDWLLYQILIKSFADDDRVQFYVPAGSDAFFRVYNVRYLLTHGDQFRAGDSIIGPLGPLARGRQKKLARDAAIGRDFDVMLAGHWHTYIHMTTMIVNGSLKGMDEYAAAENYAFEEPQQALWIVNPRYGCTFRMPVQCEPPAKPRKAEWVSVAA